jgi:MOSC domain-containing protein YiiM
MAGMDSSRGHVTAVCVVFQLLPDPGQDPEVTAIDKRPRPGRLDVGPLGLLSDTQCDTKFHGGPDQALYAYSDEEAQWWAGELDREIPPGLFGENLRTSGIEVSGAEIGERWRIGTPDTGSGVLVEVTSPRTPCPTFQARMGEPHWVKRFAQRGWPGAYLRVVTPGTVAAGDPVVVDRRPGHGVTVADTFLRPEPARMRTLLEAEAAGLVELGAVMRGEALRAARRSARTAGPA